MDGPIGQYCFKYGLKGTQKDDTEEYSRVQQASQRVLSSPRRHQSDRSEAMRRVLVGSFAHQKTNVVGAPMASFLTRKHRRFIFSHGTGWCPLRDIKDLMRGGASSALIHHNGDKPYYQCFALNYLCRPVELESVSPFTFYSEYESVRATSKNEDELLKFCNREFQHPSFVREGNRFLQGVRRRRKPVLSKVLQYDFPDTANFHGSMLEEHFIENESTETYCELAMLLFLPYRVLHELLPPGHLFTSRFREVVANGLIGDEELQILQNIQDVKSNSFRVTRLEDSLQRNTECYMPQNPDGDSRAEEETEDNTMLQGQHLDDILALLESEESDMSEDTEAAPNSLPASVSFRQLRQKGRHKCGYERLAKMTATLAPSLSTFVATDLTYEGALPRSNQTDDEGSPFPRGLPTKSDIVKLLLERRTRRQRSFSDISGSNEPVDVLEANGSVQSILDWAREAKLDSGQKRAFEVFASTFVLSFYSGSPGESTVSGSYRNAFVAEKSKLRTLGDCRGRGSDQLVCFLHGPAGSGKTTVVDMLMKYANECCDNISHPFTSRTIVVTAMTGVAATILRGDTLHRSAYLNQLKPLEAEQIEAWEETRMLIVDEISFASKLELSLLHKKLRRLKERLDAPFGGLDVIFAGDMRQLEPVGSDGMQGKKNPLYADDCPEFKDWVNCYMELNGMHRFQNDPLWGELLLRFRAGTVTEEDIDFINERVNDDELPDNIRYATFFNKDRDAINTALFEERCRRLHHSEGCVDDSVLIFCSNVKVQTGAKTYVPFRHPNILWENCGEDDVSLHKGRMDPVLRLYPGIRIMLPDNIDVKNGQANGTQAVVEQIFLKPGEQTHQILLEGEFPVTAVSCDQIAYISLRHCNERIQPSTFSLKPVSSTFKAKIPKPRALRVKGDETEQLKMKATQLPMVVNNATTGHKLQGSGVDCLFVHNWSYVANWVYVMLSRVKKHSGLHARLKLSKDLKHYAVPEALTSMIRMFRTRTPASLSEEDYRDLFE